MEVSLSRPFVYGNTAVALKEPTPENNTHSWTVYLRPATNQSIASLIKKVVFSLHNSFANPVRTLEAPPFEVTENGWGEFEVLIKIYFKVPSTKTVTLRHFLKLFPGEDTLVLNKKILVKETYDEFVFSEAHPQLVELLRLPATPEELESVKQLAHDYIKEEEEQYRRARAAFDRINAALSSSKSLETELDAQVAAIKSDIITLESGQLPAKYTSAAEAGGASA